MGMTQGSHPSMAAQRMDPEVPLDIRTLSAIAFDSGWGEVRGGVLFCKTKLGTVECMIDKFGVAWIYQVVDADETIWWHGACRQDELRKHLQAAIENANQKR